jgi:hypothetical protein
VLKSLYGVKKMKSLNWEKFHDWKIGPIIIDWVNGITKIHLSLENVCEIEIIDFKNVSIPRFLPWGKSQYVNKIKCEKNKLNNWDLEFELQSGDTLKIEGSRISINE